MASKDIPRENVRNDEPIPPGEEENQEWRNSFSHNLSESVIPLSGINAERPSLQCAAPSSQYTNDFTSNISSARRSGATSITPKSRLILKQII